MNSGTIEERKNLHLTFLISITGALSIVCSTIWHYFYWDSFGINIFPLLDTGTFVVSAIYCFVFISVVLCALIAMRFTPNSIIEKYQRTNFRIATILILIVAFCVLSYSLQGSYCIFVSIITGYIIASFLNARNVLARTFEHSVTRKIMIFIFVLAPCFTSGLAKFRANKVYHESQITTTHAKMIVNISGTNMSSSAIDCIFVGETNDFMFALSLDRKSIIRIPFDNIDFIERPAH